MCCFGYFPEAGAECFQNLVREMFSRVDTLRCCCGCTCKLVPCMPLKAKTLEAFASNHQHKFQILCIEPEHACVRFEVITPDAARDSTALTLVAQKK